MGIKQMSTEEYYVRIKACSAIRESALQTKPTKAEMKEFERRLKESQERRDRPHSETPLEATMRLFKEGRIWA